jgi:hypothetical protein
MTLKLSLAATAFAAGIACATMPGLAANPGSFGVLKEIGAAQPSGVEKTHGWHRTCKWGLNGWHKHVPGVGRVQCTMHKCWTNRWGFRRCRWF